MERFDWSHTLSAPKGYACILLQGSLIAVNSDEYSASYGKWGVTNSGWGRASGSVVSGPDLKAIPDSLSITWLSLLEDKFYTGRFQLPREKITKLFQEGFYNHKINKIETYDEIVVGMAPGGLIVIWILSGQVETEVAKFQATEIKIDPSTLRNDQQYLFKQSYREAVFSDYELEKKEIPFDLWDNYRIKHSWRHRMDFPHGFKNTESYLSMYNGEKERLFIQEPKHQDFRKRALPQDMRLLWTDDKGGLWGAEVYFDETELFKAFEELLDKDPEQNIEIVFTPNAANTAFTVMLQSKTEEIDLPKTKVKPYPRAQ